MICTSTPHQKTKLKPKQISKRKSGKAHLPQFDKKIFAPLFFSPLKEAWAVCLMKCKSVAFPWTTMNHYSLKYQCLEVDTGKLMCMAINKSVALETHPPKWKCYKEIAQGRNQRPGPAWRYWGKKSFSPKIVTKVSMNILITTRILLLVILRMALKGSELYSRLFKVSVTQSFVISTIKYIIIEILYTNLR